MIGSTAAVMTPAVREELLSLLPQGVLFLESFGGSELGLQAMSYNTDSGERGLPAYELRENTIVLNEARTAMLEKPSATSARSATERICTAS
jgi:hypothetical protein